MCVRVCVCTVCVIGECEHLSVPCACVSECAGECKLSVCEMFCVSYRSIATARF